MGAGIGECLARRQSAEMWGHALVSVCLGDGVLWWAGIGECFARRQSAKTWGLALVSVWPGDRVQRCGGMHW